MTKFMQCYLIRKIGESIEELHKETFLFSVKPCPLPQKRFRLITLAELVCEREDGLIKSWPYPVFQYSRGHQAVLWFVLNTGWSK